MKEERDRRKSMDKFVRYPDGAAMYHVSVSTFMQWAKDAKRSIYKVKQLVLVNLEIIDEYLEAFHIVDGIDKISEIGKRC